ncbi:MAG TPA: hypothetical protein VIK81_00790 [Patescibacteria group bacterium]
MEDISNKEAQSTITIGPEKRQLRPLAIMTFTDGDKKIRTKLQPKTEEFDDSKYPDPFVAINQETGQPVNLNSHQRLSAYRLTNLEAPEDLLRGLEQHEKIRIKKEKEISEKAKADKF